MPLEIKGNMTTSRIYTKVTDKDGKDPLELKLESTQVISPQTAYIVYDMLKGSVILQVPMLNLAIWKLEVRLVLLKNIEIFTSVD